MTSRACSNSRSAGPPRMTESPAHVEAGTWSRNTRGPLRTLTRAKTPTYAPSSLEKSMSIRLTRMPYGRGCKELPTKPSLSPRRPDRAGRLLLEALLRAWYAGTMGSKSKAAQVLIVPGIGNSGPQHWRTICQPQCPDFRRVQQREWDRPVCAEWVASFDETVRGAGAPVVLVAHSLGCLLVAHWAAASANGHIHGALLVAVPDPEGPSFPKEASGFSPLPVRPLGFPSVVVASADDPYGSAEHAARCAAAWGSRLVGGGGA